MLKLFLLFGQKDFHINYFDGKNLKEGRRGTVF